MSPWSLLGLDADADTRSIKRRYAQLLKTHRPDEDAEAFQRLREAYEQALLLAEGNVREPVDPARAPAQHSLSALATRGDETLIQLQPAPVETLEDDRAERLLEQSASLDEALAAAREQGLEPALQRHLLTRCQAPGEDGLAILRWAMVRLQWLTPWQADYLPLVHMNILAMRVFDSALCAWRQQLNAGQERAVLDDVQQLLAEAWLQPFDRRSHAQQELLALLEEGDGWSLIFFDGLCQLLGWDEGQGQIPCDRQRWERLCLRCDGLALRDELRRLLDEARPEYAQARAAWLLFKPLSDAERRKLTDAFEEADWQACESLARRLELQGSSGLLELLGVSYLQQWRAWRPGRGWRQLYPLLWAGISLVLLLLIVLKKDKGVEGFADLAMTLCIVSVLATTLVVMLRFFAKGWNRFARWQTLFDVTLSQWLLPASWARRGTGILVLRHIVPSAVLAGLTFSWAGDLLYAPVFALLTFALCVQFVNVATRDGLPAAWLIVIWRRVAPLGKQILLWLLILTLAFVLSRLLIESKRQEHEATASRPLEVLHEGLDSGDALQQGYENAMKSLQEALA
ncbi:MULTISPECIES: J domain-containing protein [Pseudomonas]|uniref:J domain-containing protein n=1 Tax=Pseudomonas TaxID=286 RepID=UPI0015A73810|nr:MULTISPECIES: J domain-containing protein [Pseudomonas]